MPDIAQLPAATVAYLAMLGLVSLERLLELKLSGRNAAWALARGGVEVGQRHFVAMKLLHAAFLLACALEVLLAGRPAVLWLGAPMLALALAAQALRYWAVASLGRHWNVRVIVVPGAAVIDKGPYRFVRHPNYLAVILEGVALPLVHSAWLTAAVFTVANAALLALRIRCEERALLRLASGYKERIRRRPRLLPLPLLRERGGNE